MKRSSNQQDQLEQSQEANKAVFTEQELALARITKDFTVALNKKEVKDLISTNPLFEGMTKPEMLALKHNAQRRLKRIEEDMKGSRRKAKAQQKIEQMAHMRSQSDISSMNDNQSSKIQVVVKQKDEAERTQLSTIDQKTRQRMIQILRCMATLKEDHPLMKATISRIVHPSFDDATELQEIYRLYDEQQAAMIKDLMKQQDYEALRRATKSVSAHSVLDAFIEVARHDESVMKNQQLISIVALTAINTAEQYPEISGAQVSTARALIDACIVYLKDKETVPEQGLLIYSHSMGLLEKTYFPFAGKLNAHSSLQKALLKIGLTLSTAQLIIKNHEKLCYSSYIDAVLQLNQEEQKVLCNVISKLKQDINPGDEALEISSLLRSRVILSEQLIQLDGQIDISPQQLLEALKFLVEPRFEREQIKRILQLEPDQWMREIKHINEELKSGRTIQSFEASTYQAKAEEEGIEEAFLSIQDLSQALASECGSYSHNAFQVYAASKLASDNRATTMGILQTGTGKSFVCTLLAMYYQQAGSTVAIVTSQMYLVDQIKTMLGPFHQQLQILTMHQALDQWQKFETLIIDECDECFMSYGVVADREKSQINGFWEFIGKRCILLTATVQTSMQEVTHQLFGLKVKDYLDLGQTLKVSEPSVCRMKFDYAIKRTQEEQVAYLKEILTTNMRQRPMIVFFDESRIQTIVKDFCKENQLQMCKALTDDQLPAAKIKISEWNYGICLVNRRFCRGSDLRFNEDSLVIGTFLPSSKQELIQMTGRSSRTMSDHHSITIIVDKGLSKDTIEDHLATVQLSKLRDAIWAAKVLLGKHLLSSPDDGAIIDFYKKGWYVQKYKLMKVFKLDEARKFELEAEKWIIENSGLLIDENDEKMIIKKQE